ncbi:hypothetical protein M0804_015141 [Polistes exclamans]|nr:hypothetical protein M0804_015141 [Polistes exclamans]
MSDNINDLRANLITGEDCISEDHTRWKLAVLFNNSSRGFMIFTPMYIASGFIAFLSSTFPVVICGAFESSSRLKELLRGYANQPESWRH